MNKVDPQTIEQLQTASKKYDEAINNNDDMERNPGTAF